ncbi:MAG: hypothetical protein FJ128_07925 [Deltaproteobacteria bacterium]|nr:hypothetical protein [Deltaproteobacteria bacterium]MBM4285162.1 hypothetical protein [Deltaproteobacteria bacterium]
MDIKGLLEVLGNPEEPLGMFYTDVEPEEGFSPQPGNLPSAAAEARGEVDFGALFGAHSCVLGHIWRARRQGGAAYFSRERFGCLGGAFYLGFLKPQLEAIVHYVSTGVPGMMEGERYLESPQATRNFFNYIDPRPAPAAYCVFQPLSRFAPGEQPEIVILFGRPEMLSGLVFLASFVTNDLEAVVSPFGADCSYLVTWPLWHLARGNLKAVLGGWDPTARKYHQPDELSFAAPWELFRRMAQRWPESFLTGDTWAGVKKKIALSRRTWEKR